MENTLIRNYSEFLAAFECKDDIDVDCFLTGSTVYGQSVVPYRYVIHLATQVFEEEGRRERVELSLDVAFPFTYDDFIKASKRLDYYARITYEALNPN